ncbi:MAG: glycine cleavage system aminomethyltransferase GcvT [Ignavibacteriales bacterium]|nr:glycine cleavage system aminomethyltransferase GcvT [Ignavibacteriales bacterium]
MKRTPFFSIHQNLGAKIVPFGGYEMPVQYAGIMEEHKSVRNNVGVFDVSHMGEFFAKGPNALSFLQKITVNDVSKLVPGKAQYSAMCYENGGIVDDLLIYMLAEHSYMIVVNAANIDKDWEWMKSHCPSDVGFENKSDVTALLAIQGPKSLNTMQKLTKADLSSIQYYNFVQSTLAGVDMIISRTGYTGELGFEIYFDVMHGEKIWTAIFDAGKEFNIAPIGLGARDTLRLEMGYCLYGNDIDQTTHPLEAGLGWITKLNKGDFIGKPVLEKAKAEGLKRKLVGMMLSDKAVPRHGYQIVVNGAHGGTITSGTFSPSLEKGIAMGYVNSTHSEVGSKLQVDVRGKLLDAAVVPLPFLKKN